jgi:CheY-like chemotaxis protein
MPCFIFLDLKLPLVSGFAVLEWLRSQPVLAETPVVILTGSSEQRDKNRATELGARAYYVKPPDEKMVRDMLEWLAGKRVTGPPEQMVPTWQIRAAFTAGF